MSKNEKLFQVKYAFCLIHYIVFDECGSEKKADELFDLALLKADQILRSPSKYYKGIKVSNIKFENKHQRRWFIISILKHVCRKCNMDYNKISSRILRNIILI